MNDLTPTPFIPLEFPNSPAVGDQYVAPNGVTYQWDGVVWTISGSGTTPLTELQYQGPWGIAANSPDLTAITPEDGQFWSAHTANYLFAEQAPAGIPGIGGATIWNGWFVQWMAATNSFRAINNMTLTINDVNTVANGYVLKTGDTMTGALTISMANPNLQLNKLASGQNAGIVGEFNGNNRWALALGDNGAETGADSGSNFTIARFRDDGTYIDFPMYISRATGETTFVDMVSSPVVPVNDSNLTNKLYVDTAITTALLGYLPLTAGPTVPLTGALWLGYANPSIVLSSIGTTATNAIVGGRNGLRRWSIYLGEGSPEIGGNAGSNFEITSQNDAGNNLHVPFEIDRSSGIVTINNALALPNLPVDDDQAANKLYVDTALASIVAFQGLYQVWLNNPDLTPAVLNPQGGDYWVASTEDPLVADQTIVDLPGIPIGTEISNSDLILWSDADSQYHLLSGTGGGLTKPEADTYYVALAGSTMTGPLILSEPPQVAMQAATKQYVDDAVITGDYLPLDGGTMRGPILLPNAAPVALVEATTKQYVDSRPTVPPGGTADQVLTKISAVDYAAEWRDSGGVIDNTIYFVNRTPQGSTGGSMNITTIGAWNYAANATNAPPVGTNGGGATNTWILHVFRSGLYIIQEAYETVDGITANSQLPIFTKWMRSQSTNMGNNWQPWIQQPITMPGNDFVLKVGDTMTGPLVLPGPPINPLEATTKAYVDQLVSSQAVLIASIDASTGICTFVDGSANGPLPPVANVSTGDYVIADTGGTIPSGPAAGETMKLGDWLIATAAGTWFLLEVGSGNSYTASQISVVPTVLGTDDVQEALELIAPAINPPGGATGQILTKIDGTDYSYEWADPSLSDPDNVFLNRGSLPNQNLNLVTLPGAYRITAGATNIPPTSVSVSDQWLLHVFGPDETGGLIQEIYELWREQAGVPGIGDYRILTKWMRNNSMNGWTAWVQQPITMPAPPDLTAYLPLAGGTMLGPLLLANDPISNNEAATKRYVDTLFSGAAQLVGTIDATTGICTFVDASTGPVPAATGSHKFYICSVAGTIPVGSEAAGIIMRKGDEIYDAETGTWILVAVGSGGLAALASDIALVPNVHGADNVQTGMERTVATDGTSIMTGPLIFDAGTPAVPSPTIRSVGTKVSLYPSNAGNGYDLGVESGNMWFNLPGASNGYKLYFNGVQRYLFDQNYLTLPAAPTANMHAATKQYVDSKLALTGGTVTGGVNHNAWIILKQQGSGGNSNLYLETYSGANNGQVAPSIYWRDEAGRNIAQFQGVRTGYNVNVEGNVICYTSNGGWGWQEVFRTTVNSSPGVNFRGPITAQSYANNSDVSKKENIQFADPMMAQQIMEQLEPIKFKWKEEQWYGNPEDRPAPNPEIWGLSANAVEQVMPEAVTTNEEGLKAYDLAQLLAISIAEIKRLGDVVAQLQARLQ
jgi:hypothetical protein